MGCFKINRVPGLTWDRGPVGLKVWSFVLYNDRVVVRECCNLSPRVTYKIVGIFNVESST